MHIHFDFWPTLSFLLVMFSWFLFAIVFVLQKRPPSPPDKERDPGSLMGVMLQGVSYAVVWAWHRHRDHFIWICFSGDGRGPRAGERMERHSPSGRRARAGHKRSLSVCSPSNLRRDVGN